VRHLFVAPHPDDVEIGCGGLVHKLRQAGELAAIAVCTGNGDLAMVHSGQTVPFQQRREEQLAAASHLLNPDVHFLDLAPASRFDSVEQVEFVSAFDALFPHADVIYVPLPSYNADHNRVWDAARAAFRPGRLDGKALYAYEQPFGNDPPPWGKTYVELSREDVGAKCAAIAAHASQMEGRMASIYGPHAASLFASLRGKEIGLAYAELLYRVRAVQLISRKGDTHDA
jgi:LmbE family N-acetylglucosaminyl deacetylase